MVHTGKVPSGAVLDWVPDKGAVAFAVIHFSGMFGPSEAHAEYVGSTLKRYAKTLSMSCDMECTMLRQHGLTGYGFATATPALGRPRQAVGAPGIVAGAHVVPEIAGHSREDSGSGKRTCRFQSK